MGDNIRLVSDYASYNIFSCYIASEKIMTYERFKNKYLLQCHVYDLKKIDCFLFHLYYEEKGNSYKCFLTETIIRDPLHNAVSEIICGIIFNILNKHNKEYMEELLGKIKFVSQNPAYRYNWGNKYFSNFENCFISFSPTTKIGLDTLNKYSLLIKQEEINNFIEETYKAIKSAFTRHG